MEDFNLYRVIYLLFIGINFFLILGCIPNAIAHTIEPPIDFYYLIPFVFVQIGYHFAFKKEINGL